MEEQQLNEMINKIIEFNKAFEIPYNTEPSLVPDTTANLRFSLMHEENQEYHIASVIDKNIVEVADALGDKLYILLGSIVAHGMQDVIVKVFNEIHRSNMTKLDSEGKVLRRGDGKIIKSSLYEKPNLAQFFLNESNP